MSGWMSWFGHIVAGSLYGLGFGSYFALLLAEFNLIDYQPGNPAATFFFTINLGFYKIPFGWDKLFAIFIILLFLFINYMGSSETGGIGNLITVTKIIIILVFIVSGLIFALQEPLSSVTKLTPVVPQELLHKYPSFLSVKAFPIFITMGFTFIAFEGFEIIVQSGEEVKAPNLNVPKAVFLALMIVVPIYVLVSLVAIIAIRPSGGQTSYQFLASSGELGLAEAARQFMPFGVIIMLIGGFVSTLSALNATTFSSSRVAFVMGRDKLLPTAMSDINEARHTPHWAISSSGLVMLLVALFLPIDDVASAADLLFIVLFIQVNYAAIKIRNKHKDKLFYGYVVPGLSIVVTLAIMLNFTLGLGLLFHSPLAFIGSIIWLLLGVVVYYAYSKHRIDENPSGDSFDPYTVEDLAEEHLI